MRTLVFALLFTSMSAALATSAFADDPTPKPRFALMDNTADGSKVDIDVATLAATRSISAGVLVRHSILGQLVAPNGFGGYGTISMSSAIPRGGVSGDPELDRVELGNLELGGLCHRALSSDVDLGMRVGVVLPTTNASFVSAFGTLLARPADLVTAIPDATWMRLGVSPTYDAGPVFLRADLGVDVPIVKNEGLVPIEHINVGAGIRHNRFIATAEMQTAFVMGGNTGDLSSDFFSVAGLSVRYDGTGVSPFLGVSTPLDRDFRGEIATATAGLTIPL